MKTFKYKNATIHVRGEVDKEKLKNATIQFLKKRTNKAKGSEFAKNNFSDMNSLIPDLVKKWVSDNESTYNKYSILYVLSLFLKKIKKH